MKVRTAVLLVAAVILLLSALYLAFGTEKPPVTNEVQFSQRFCLAGAQNSTAVQFALAAGVTCFRSDVYLNHAATSFIANLTDAGAQYLGILDYATVGAQPSPQGCISGCNWTLDTWNASVANAVVEDPEISTWEIYNEPLITNFVGGYENGSALNYFNMIKSASSIIKSRNPNATVVCFGGAQLFPLSTVQIEYQFYKQVWSYGASRYCDAISIHAYTLPYYSLSQEAYSNATLEQEYSFVLDLYENMTGKPVWITETGAPSNNWASGLNYSEQNQASFMRQDMEFFISYPFVKRVYWYALLDSGSGADFGLLNMTTLEPKPAWYSFLYFAKNST
jgi:putative glycosyl hydrolase